MKNRKNVFYNIEIAHNHIEWLNMTLQ